MSFFCRYGKYAVLLRAIDEDWTTDITKDITKDMTMETKKQTNESAVKIPSAYTLYWQSEWAMHDEFNLACFDRK